MKRMGNNNICEFDDDDSSEEQASRRQFLSYFNKSRLPPVETWSHYPLYVTSSVRAPDVVYGLPMTDGFSPSFPLDGSLVEFDGPLFKGKIQSRVSDISSNEKYNCRNPTMSNDQYFAGRSRQFQWCVQGMFKQRIRFDEIVTGQEFGKPFRNFPDAKLIKTGMALLKSRLPDSFECDLESGEPKFEHPLLAGCQLFRIDDPQRSRVPDIASFHFKSELMEDSSLLGDASVPQESQARRKYFSQTENLSKFYFEPGLIYTFDFYSNFFSPKRYALEMNSFFHVSLMPFFNGYPIFMALAKHKQSGFFLWGTEMWHSRLLNYDEKPSALARIFSSKKGVCKRKKMNERK